LGESISKDLDPTTPPELGSSLMRSLALRWHLLALALASALVLALLSANPPSAHAGCGSITLGGKPFVFHKTGITCKKAKGLARFTFRTNKPPRGWRCPDASPGNNRRDGANCFKAGNPNKSYGYHVFD
jgi:hypothetical protein